MMGRLRDQCGQTAAEYMGLLVVVGLIIAAIASSGIGAAVAAGVERAVCLSVGDGPCPTVQAQLAQDREGDDEQARQDAAARERRERQRAFEQLKATTAQSMSAVSGSVQPLDEVEGQSAGDWLLSGLGELSGANDADRGISQLGEGDILGGAFSLAMAWPGAKALKLGKEGVEEGIEQATRDGARQATKAGDDALRLPARQSFGNPAKLDDHFRRHGGDFGAKSADDYAAQASDFLQRSQRQRLPTKIDADGVVRVYDSRSNTFGAYNPSGTTRTFFKPTSRTYFDRQPGSAPRP